MPAVIARIAEIDQIVSPKPPSTPSSSTTGQSGFLSSLNGVQYGSSLAAPAAASAASTTTGATGALAAAQSQVGVAEQPPGSNDSPQIAQYRTATAGSGVGPWCAYFASWAAAQAGTPLGEAGQGFGSVSALYDWAQRTGRATPAGTGARPNPGDLIVWGGEHIGIVESVDADGSIHTIEGNSSNAVSRRTYGPDGGGATGYVHIG
ncbi:MAG TPA: CHAP domain-containing protein [Solirubrobacteraceae bacterium]